MKLEVGMYVRTKKGSIGKILGIDYRIDGNGNDLENIEGLYFDNCIDDIGKDIYSLCFYIFKDAKTSHNIIDLIEERDFVKVRIDGIFINWFMVDLFEDENENQELGIGCYEDGLLNSISEYRPLNTLEILEVLTKEQFESMSYKVGE